MELAPALLEAGARVIDLSGAFRLGTPENYKAWYKAAHTQPELLAEAVYGLPEFCRAAHSRRAAGGESGLLSDRGQSGASGRWSKRAWWTARRGSCATPNRGVSGAGRKPSLTTSFCEVTENFSAYSVLHHRHVPEVLHVSGLEEREFSFTAQLLPLDRGILETIYFRAAGIGSAEDLLAIYEKRYAGEPFVRLYESGPRARSARRGTHQLLRHRRGVRCAHAAAPWW